MILNLQFKQVHFYSILDVLGIISYLLKAIKVGFFFISYS
jgi:hypothetical protein